MPILKRIYNLRLFVFIIYNLNPKTDFQIMPAKLKQINILITALSLCALAVLSVPTLPEGIHSIIAGQFQQNSNNRSQQVMSYYDINQDQYCDMITIITRYSSQNKTVQSRYLVLYLWNESEQYFIKQTEMNLSFLSVLSVICTQFYNRNAPETDIILTYQYVTSNQQQANIIGKRYAIQFIQAVCDQNNEGNCIFKAFFGNISELKMFDPILPSIIMLQGKMSLIYRKSNQAFILNLNKNQQGEQVHSIFSLAKSNKYLSIPQTNAQVSENLAYELSYFGDYNGDGIADLIVSQKFASQNNLSYDKIHFFKYSKSTQKFVIEITYNLKNLQERLSTQLQFYSLQDINFDGRIDLIILFKCGLIQIHYNKIAASQKQLVTENGFNIFPFDLYDSSQNYVSKIQRIKVNQNYKPISTTPIIFGDFNLDGYQQIIIDYQYEVPSGQLDKNGLPIVKMYQKSLLLINQKCTSINDCGDSSYNPKFLKTFDMVNIRKFSISNSLPTVYKSNQSFKLSFIDLFKDGKLDLLSLKLSSNTAFYGWEGQAMKSRQIQIFYNNVVYDAFFMKVRVMRGKNYKQVHQNLPIAGANVNCFVTSLAGQMLPKVGNQFSQVGRMLQLPYVFLGLGRTNNYVNQLTVTIPYISEQFSYQFMWTPLVPNSQIITLANPQGVWQLTTFIEPTKKMGIVALLTILSLIGIGIAICRLNAQQKNEDKQNLQSFYTILR